MKPETKTRLLDHLWAADQVVADGTCTHRRQAKARRAIRDARALVVAEPVTEDQPRVTVVVR